MWGWVSGHRWMERNGLQGYLCKPSPSPYPPSHLFLLVPSRTFQKWYPEQKSHKEVTSIIQTLSWPHFPPSSAKSLSPFLVLENKEKLCNVNKDVPVRARGNATGQLQCRSGVWVSVCVQSGVLKGRKEWGREYDWCLEARTPELDCWIWTWVRY